MIIKEVKKDLFTVSDDYALVHCISADFKLGAGIAKKFDELFDVRQKLFNVFPESWIPRWDKTQERFRGGSIILFSDYTFFNLVTKRNYWDKPTLTAIENALVWMKEQCEDHYITKLAMPRIGCGLDKQNWSDVKQLIEKVFADTDIEIVVCSL
jgi:hypothetical protein